MRSFRGGLLGFGLCLFRLSLRHFRLLLRFFGINAALGFGLGVGTSLCFALFGGGLFGSSFGLSFVLGALFHRHHPRFFCGLSGFARCGFDDRPALLLAVGNFGLHELLVSLCKD